jgi:hypothetical protein
VHLCCCRNLCALACHLVTPSCEVDQVTTFVRSRQEKQEHAIPASRMQAWCGHAFEFLPIITVYVPFKRAKYVLDAGANIGFAALQFAPLIHYRGKVRNLTARSRVSLFFAVLDAGARIGFKLGCCPRRSSTTVVRRSACFVLV